MVGVDFDSLSGSFDGLRRATGKPPRNAQAKRVFQVAQIISPLGPILVAGDEAAVHLVEFWDRRMLEAQFSGLEKRWDVVFFPGETGPIRQMREELNAYFSGDLRTFTTPMLHAGSEHQEQVWRALMDVPYGETWSYGKLAARVGRPTAVRSVARAVGENRMAIMLPCHRIIGADGRLTGYAGGLWRKQFLLNHEGCSKFIHHA